MDRVSVCIINHNGGRFLSRCIDSVLDQDHKDIEIIVIDNASTDGSRAALKECPNGIRVMYNDINAGFCAAVNTGIANSSGQYFLCLNPDVFLMPEFVSTAIKAFSAGDKIGSVSGKLRRYDEEKGISTDIIDSAGIVLNRAFRAYDRGSMETDAGQYDGQEEVFAACGAAALYRRDFLEDIKTGAGEYFDEMFFAYKEDVDVAWRGRKKGWRCIYAPGAVACHVRGFQKGNRKAMPPDVRYHSFKNRHMLLLKNLSLGEFVKYAPFIVPYEISLLAYALLFDRHLLKSYGFVLKNMKTIISQRRA